MIVKFKDGTVKQCSNPTEQKVFRGGEATGWLCSFVISDNMTSSEVDSLLSSENMSNMVFSSDDEKVLFEITGYEKVSSAVVRHSETTGNVEIQLTKGV